MNLFMYGANKNVSVHRSAERTEKRKGDIILK